MGSPNALDTAGTYQMCPPGMSSHLHVLHNKYYGAASKRSPLYVLGCFHLRVVHPKNESKQNLRCIQNGKTDEMPCSSSIGARVWPLRSPRGGRCGGGANGPPREHASMRTSLVEITIERPHKEGILYFRCPRLAIPNRRFQTQDLGSCRRR